MKIKVYGGTPAGGNLCDSCVHLRQIQGVRDSDCIRTCKATGSGIPFAVAKCSYYQEKIETDRYGKPLYLSFNRKKNCLLIGGDSLFGPGPQTVEQYRAECAANEEVSAAHAGGVVQ